MKSRKRRPQASKAQIEALFTASDYLEECGELHAAFQCLLAAAQAGDEGSQLNLGNFYSDGTGVRKDLGKATYWYRKSYNNRSRGVRNSSAAVNIGINFRDRGNTKAAIAWFERARALTDGSACFELAKIHAARKGGRRKAVALLQEMLELDQAHSTERDRQEAEALLKVLLLH